MKKDETLFCKNQSECDKQRKQTLSSLQGESESTCWLEKNCSNSGGRQILLGLAKFQVLFASFTILRPLQESESIQY